MKYQIDLSLKDMVSSAVAKVRKEFERLNKKTEEAQEKAERFGSICERIGNLQFKNFIDMLDRSVQAFEEATGSGMEYEQAMADLVAITGIAGKELEEIGRVARQTGKESGLGATGAVNAFTLLASQIQIDKIGLQGLMTLQKETITLAQAAGMDMAEAATAMAATINQFGLEATEANRVINVLAAGSKYGAAEISDLAQSFKVTGSTAAAAGLSVEQTAGALEVLSQSNLKGAEAGTALRNILLKMQTTLGMDFTKVGLDTALEALKPKLNDVTYLAKLFGAENIAAAQYLITNAQAVGELTQQVTGTTVAQEQAAIRTDTAAEAYKRLQAKMDDVKISFFEATGALAPYIAVTGDALPIIASLMAVVGSTAQVIAFFQKNAILAKTAIVAKTAAELAAVGVMKVVAAGQAALNAVMAANPVALVVLAIAALVAGLVYAYKHSDRFREVVDKLWEGFKKVVAVVWDYVVKAFEDLSKAVKKVWNAIKKFLGIGQDAADQAEEVAESTEKMADANDNAAKSVANLTGALSTQGKSLSTIAGLEERINELKTKQKEASLQNAIAIEKEVRAYEDRLEAIKRQIAIGASDMQHLAEGKYGKLTAPDIQGVDPVKGVKIPVQFDEAALARSWRQCQQQFSDSIKEIELTGEKIGSIVTGAIQQFATGFGEALASGNALEIFNTLLMSLMDMLQQFGSALIAAGMATLAFKSLFANPIAAIISGTAMVTAAAAAKAALQNATAFANGGIVSGPTYALVGEYAGAKSNPEVIAPLNKLRSLIEPARTDTKGLRLETKIRGKDLYVVLRSVEHEKIRTR